jgi:D-glycerate 3-kinase
MLFSQAARLRIELRKSVTQRLSQAAARVDAAIEHRLASRVEDAPFIVGVCGSQGSGKSTLCQQLSERWREKGMRIAVLSLDDLYLTRAERQTRAQNIHPLLATRGVPGTHDVELGVRTLRALAGHEPVKLPRFDKANDDRRPEVAWDVTSAPVDVVLFEGWCVGAQPQSRDKLLEPMNPLETIEDADGRWRNYVNEQLGAEYQRLFAMTDYLVLLAAPSFDVVLRWRTQQEQELRKQQRGSAVMDDAALARFVQHYERLTRHILDQMPSRADLVIRLDENRRVVPED